MREHLINVAGFRELARPTSVHIEQVELEKYIEECEDMYIIPAVGLTWFKTLCGDDIDDTMTEEYTLLNGGDWTDDSCGCDTTTEKRCYGLRKALSYYVYGRMIQNDGSIMTRTGLMRHNDEYASRDDDKNRVRKYNEVIQVAETYLSTCLDYLNHITGDCKTRKVRGRRLQIHAIGD